MMGSKLREKHHFPVRTGQLGGLIRLAGKDKMVTESGRNCLVTLKAFIGLDRHVSLGQLAEAAGLNKTSVYRALRTLMESGFVEQDPETQKYRLGVGVLGPAAHYLSKVDFRTAARPLVEEFVRRRGETVTLGIPYGDELVFIDRVIGSNDAVFYCDVGRHLPLHCGAAGKAVLAWLPDERREAYISSGLSSRTPKTITDPDALRAELEGIRRQGYAVSDQEVDLGIRAVAVPVFDFSGQVAGGIAVAGVAARFDEDAIERFAAELVQIGREVSKLLGWTKLADTGMARPLAGWR